MFLRNRIIAIYLLSIVQLTGASFLCAQDNDSSNNKEEKYVYKPYSQRMREADTSVQDNSSIEEEQSIMDSDSIDAEEQARLDSIAIREQFVRDSILIREQFVRDSILAREQFVRDSLLRRKEIKDSVDFLKQRLPVVLAASIYTQADDIIISTDKLTVIGDSMLSDFTYKILPNRTVDPYTPWKGELKLSNSLIEINIDPQTKLISSIKGNGLDNTFEYNMKQNVIIIKTQGRFASKYGSKYYKAPVDTVFISKDGNVAKVKRYFTVYQATDNFKLGSKLFDFVYQVKQFTYSGTVLVSMEKIKFCDRWKTSDPEKVCGITNYTFQKIGYSYEMVRANDPANNFSDGTYKYEFDNLDNLKSVSFRNKTNTENWKTFIELNESGNVSRYVYQDKGIVNKTLLVNYYLDDPKAKHKVETITCTFEDDGVSYFQHNNTTGKSRSRDKLTAIWGPWQ